MIKEQLIREAQAKQTVYSQNATKMDKPVSSQLTVLCSGSNLYSPLNCFVPSEAEKEEGRETEKQPGTVQGRAENVNIKIAYFDLLFPDYLPILFNLTVDFSTIFPSNHRLFPSVQRMQEEREGKLKDRSLFKNDGDKGPFKPGFKNQFGKDHSDLSAKLGENQWLFWLIRHGQPDDQSDG